ncbi:MBL fold metallo-hydrolase [Bordetella petrii]|nr:MBL fold metallo-hydrolase [Bordetella petrii]
MPLTILPLDLGTLNVDKSGLTLRKGLGQRVDAPCLGYLIMGGPRPILVDSGPCADVEWGSRHHNPFTRRQDQALPRALRAHGVEPDDIRTVILTHLHWDHCYGNKELPQARFVVQRKELAYAIAPLQCDAPIYESHLHPVHFLGSLDRFHIIDGDHDIMPGIRCILLPGHTPGLQGVLVDTAQGRMMLVSDHCPLYENYEQGIPTGILHSLEDWYRSTARIHELAEGIYPGHDSRVLSVRQENA